MPSKDPILDKQISELSEAQKAFIKEMQKKAKDESKGFKLTKRKTYHDSSGNEVTFNFSITIARDGRAFGIGNETLGRGTFGEVRASQDLDHPEISSVVKIFRKDDKPENWGVGEERKRKEARRKEPKAQVGEGQAPEKQRAVPYSMPSGKDFLRERKRLTEAGQLHGVVSTSSKVYLHQETIEGTNLKKLVDAPEYDHLQNLRIAKAFCKGVKSLHDKDIIHRDIKPVNALYNQKTGIVHLIDIGDSVNISAKATKPGDKVTKEYYSDAATKKLRSERTKSGRITTEDGRAAFYSPDAGFVGSPGYAAPEIAKFGRKGLEENKGIFSKSSDVFALGKSLMDLFQGHIEEKGELSQLIKKMMDPIPTNRPSIEEVLKILENQPQLKAFEKKEEELKENYLAPAVALPPRIPTVPKTQAETKPLPKPKNITGAAEKKIANAYKLMQTAKAEMDRADKKNNEELIKWNNTKGATISAWQKANQVYLNKKKAYAAAIESYNKVVEAAANASITAPEKKDAPKKGWFESLSEKLNKKKSVSLSDKPKDPGSTPQGDALTRLDRASSTVSVENKTKSDAEKNVLFTPPVSPSKTTTPTATPTNKSKVNPDDKQLPDELGWEEEPKVKDKTTPDKKDDTRRPGNFKF